MLSNLDEQFIASNIKQKAKKYFFTRNVNFKKKKNNIELINFYEKSKIKLINTC